MTDIEQLKADLDAMERVEQVMARYSMKGSMVFDAIKNDISQKIEEAGENARWAGIRSEIDGVVENLTKGCTYTHFTIKRPSMIALIEYIRHLEGKAGVTNDRA